MKTLKFKQNLVDLILKGEKTSTWRLFDDKNLQEGDELLFINKDTGAEFGTAKITSLKVKTFHTLSDKDWDGHEKYTSKEEMLATFRGYYGDKVNEKIEVKIIDFIFSSLLPS